MFCVSELREEKDKRSETRVFVEQIRINFWHLFRFYNGSDLDPNSDCVWPCPFLAFMGFGPYLNPFVSPVKNSFFGLIVLFTPLVISLLPTFVE